MASIDYKMIVWSTITFKNEPEIIEKVSRFAKEGVSTNTIFEYLEDIGANPVHQIDYGTEEQVNKETISELYNERQHVVEINDDNSEKPVLRLDINNRELIGCNGLVKKFRVTVEKTYTQSGVIEVEAPNPDVAFRKVSHDISTGKIKPDSEKIDWDNHFEYTGDFEVTGDVD